MIALLLSVPWAVVNDGVGATGQSLAALKISWAIFAESQHAGGSVSGMSLLDTFIAKQLLQANIQYCCDCQ